MDLNCALDDDYRNAVAQTQEQVGSCNLRHWLNVLGFPSSSFVSNAEDDNHQEEPELADDLSFLKNDNHQEQSELASDQIDSVLDIESPNTRSTVIIDRTPLNFDDRQSYVTHSTEGVTRLAENIVEREIRQKSIQGKKRKRREKPADEVRDAVSWQRLKITACDMTQTSAVPTFKTIVLATIHQNPTMAD